MKISVIFGTRPEAIKLAPVILALKKDPRIQCRVCVTGQHRQMLDQVLEVFAIEPDTDLSLMSPNQSLAGLTSKAIEALDHYLANERPDLVLVQGDTTTVFCATLAAFYRHIPVGHVEAGLRTWNLQSPWPEEANRVLTTRLASVHFAPTQGNRENLLREGVEDSKIVVTGNTVIDALLIALDRVRKSPPNIPGLPDSLQPGNVEFMRGGQPGGRRIVLITGHRRENFGSGFENICEAIADLAKEFKDVQFVYPVHLNPNVREPVLRILGNGAENLQNIHLLEPLSYLPFVALMEMASLILTDSGGVQEEAPSLGKPVLVMRDTTERPEALKAGTVKLVGISRRGIYDSAKELLTDASSRVGMEKAHNPYGDGLAAARIRRICLQYCNEAGNGE